jgi:hypothetical protein
MALDLKVFSEVGQLGIILHRTGRKRTPKKKIAMGII